MRCAWYFSFVAATVFGRAFAHLTQRDIESEWTGRGEKKNRQAEGAIRNVLKLAYLRYSDLPAVPAVNNYFPLLKVVSGWRLFLD